MELSNLYYRNPRLLVLTVLLVVVAGLVSFQVLPRAEDPSLTNRFGIIATRLPGADAARVEALVTETLEDELREVEEIKKLDSNSRGGISIVMIELDDGVTDADEVWSRVRSRLDDAQVRLPATATKPDLEVAEIEASTLIAAVTWQRDDEPVHALLQRLAEDLQDRLRGVPGTAEVDLFGETPEEVRVEIDPARLAALGLSTADVARAIESTDAKVAAGQLRGERESILMEVEGELETLDRLARTPIRYGDGEQVVRLGAVARIRKTVREPAGEIALVDGRPGVAVAARIGSGRRVDHWAAQARAELDAFQARLPRGVGLELLFDQSIYTERRLDNLFGNLALGAVLVLGTVLLLMGWRSALMVGTALPLSVLMVFAGMRALGIPVHQMSVTGLIIALGLLIDNAIVIVDEVRHRLRDGERAAEAVARAVRALAVPLFGSTLTTALAFAPIALMPGGAGEFVGSIALSVILAIFSSLGLALTVVAALAGRLSGKGERVARRSWLRDGFSNPSLTRAYSWSLGAFFARPKLVVVAALLLPAAGLWKGMELEEQFFPPTERDQFPIELRLPAQSSLQETRRVAMRARDLILRHDQVEAVHWFVGASAPKFYYNMTAGQDDTPSFAQALVQLRSVEGATALIHGVQAELDAAFPEAQFLARQFEQGPPFSAPIELRLYGPDTQRLEELGRTLRTELARIPGVTHTRTTLEDGHPKLLVRTDEEQANLAGFDHRVLAGRLQTTLEGALGGSLLEGGEQLPVRVGLAATDRADLDRIASLELVTPGNAGDWTPLDAIAKVELRPELAGIPRRNGEHVNVVQGYLDAGLLPSSVLRVFRQRVAALDLPPGYRYEFGGEAEGRDEAVGNLMASVGVLLVLMVATLVLSFQSFRLAGVIGTVALLCFGLSFGALWLFDYPFGFMGIVGTMGLIGVAINDSIVVLAAIREDAAARAGDVEGIRRVVVRSTRHVIATTVTTIAGFVPLLVDGGGFWPPVAVTIAGGVAGSTLLALYYVPALYLLVRPRTAVAVPA